MPVAPEQAQADPTAPDAASEAVPRAVRDSIAAFRAQHRMASSDVMRVVIALSGGRDSMALLDAVARDAPALGITPSAVHVHHGLSANADAWAAFCGDECARRGIALEVQRVEVPRAPRTSREAAARTARYDVLLRAAADVVLLAHHADDQAETLLLQLLRGAGPHGLSAMPRLRTGVDAGPCLMRPLLHLPRVAIEAYARERGLAWIDDESNDDTGLRRNFLRHEITPRLAAAFPGYPATLVRAAAHAAEAAALLDQLASMDAEVAGIDGPAGAPTLPRSRFVALAHVDQGRARNLLRWFLRQHALPLPSAARLDAMLDQLLHAGQDARVRLAHAGTELGIHRDRIVVHGCPIDAYAVAWSGEQVLSLPHGTLDFQRAAGTGLAAEAIQRGRVVVRPRAGGERIQLAHNRPRRTLKHLLQEARVPAWQRDAWPLVWCDDALVAVPGIGVDVAFQAATGANGFELRWHPLETA